MRTMTTAVTEDTQQARQNQELLLAELQAAGARFRGKMVICPFHDDKSPSGSIHADRDGVWRYKCHAASCGFGGDVFDIRAKVQNRPLEDVLREASGKLPARPSRPVFETIEAAERSVSGTIQARYEYIDPETDEIDLVVLRIVRAGSKKSFLQLRRVHRGYVFEAPAKPWPLYNRRGIRKAESVVVVEGEKCVDALGRIGVTATTSPCGAGKADCADWSPLAGKRVYLWPDNDAGGIEHMRQVSAILETLEPAPRRYWLDPAGIVDHQDRPLDAKGDAADLLERLPADIRRLWIDTALQSWSESLGASREVNTLLEDTISGRRSAVEWPWPELSRRARALLPGTVTVLCGDPGATKSFLLLQALAYWHEHKLPVAAYMLEEAKSYHLYRVLAQRAANSDLFDDEWVRHNPGQVRELFGRHKEFLDSLGERIWANPNPMDISLPKLAQWVQAQAENGCRIIAIDPITAASISQTPWIHDLRFLLSAKQTIVEHGASLILVSHPKVGATRKIGLDSLAGGAAYQRFSQTVLWIQRHETASEKNVRDQHGPGLFTMNRTLHVSKARNGKGQGCRLGYYFDGGTLRLEEGGVIQNQG